MQMSYVGPGVSGCNLVAVACLNIHAACAHMHSLLCQASIFELGVGPKPMTYLCLLALCALPGNIKVATSSAATRQERLAMEHSRQHLAREKRSRCWWHLRVQTCEAQLQLQQYGCRAPRWIFVPGAAHMCCCCCASIVLQCCFTASMPLALKSCFIE
jgi:hypothetical protein